MKKNYIYYQDAKRFCIGDPDFCEKSERTFDLTFYNLANNKELLNALQLYYMYGNYGVTYTFESRAEWFCGYISAFRDNNQDAINKKLLTNPIVRLLIMDKLLIEKTKNILS